MNGVGAFGQRRTSEAEGEIIESIMCTTTGRRRMGILIIVILVRKKNSTPCGVQCD